MENGAFAPKEQMLHFPQLFQIHDISKLSKGIIMESRDKSFQDYSRIQDFGADSPEILKNF